MIGRGRPNSKTEDEKRIVKSGTKHVNCGERRYHNDDPEPRDPGIGAAKVPGQGGRSGG